MRDKFWIKHNRVRECYECFGRLERLYELSRRVRDVFLRQLGTVEDHVTISVLRFCVQERYNSCALITLYRRYRFIRVFKR